jgi:arginine/lysine/ornithine decarboxylase
LLSSDITEVDGADNLLSPSGVILESERAAARLFGAGATLFSACGSTPCVYAMLSAFKKAGGKRIAAGRYSHRSLITAAALLDLEIDWLYPTEFMSAKLGAAKIPRHSQAVFVTTVDYFGGRFDPRQLRTDLPILADNAHGAHLVFTNTHPIKQGARFCCDGVHKTMPALTGAAYLHLKNPADYTRLKSHYALFASTSPSYAVLDSLDKCGDFISRGKGKAEEAFAAIARLRQHIENLGIDCFYDDPLHLTLNTKRFGYTGFSFAEAMRNEGAECEYTDFDRVVLLFSVTTTAEDTAPILEIIRTIPRKLPLDEEDFPLLRPKVAMSPHAALYSDTRYLETANAIGGICGGITAPCPPGVPLVMPGEMFGKEEVEVLKRLGVEKVSVVKGWKSTSAPDQLG